MPEQIIPQQCEGYLRSWQVDGAQHVKLGADRFAKLVSRAQRELSGGNSLMAAIYAQIAAYSAVKTHPGCFVSPQLEGLLQDIGTRLPVAKTQCPEKSGGNEPLRILHIGSQVLSIGGPSNFIRRHIQNDSGNLHSLALTRQLTLEVPDPIKVAVAQTGGSIHLLNRQYGSILDWALRLREISNQYDLIILHKDDADVLPLIALAGNASPPTIYVNHSDQQFWLGVTASNIVMNLRRSGMNLAIARRHVPKNHAVILPTILEPLERTTSRAAAKLGLGLADSSIVMLSVAREMKFKTVDQQSYLDAHLPLLEKHENLVLMIVGSKIREEWKPALLKFGEKIKVIPETSNTRQYFEAADIYIDSFPFFSATSLLEAGCYGLPLVSRAPFPSDSGILNADLPGIEETLIRGPTNQQYHSAISSLIENAELRLSTGERTRSAILQQHIGRSWLNRLHEIYQLSRTTPRIKIDRNTIEDISQGTPDSFISFVCEYGWTMDDVFREHLRLMPLTERMRHWLPLAEKRGRFGRIPYLLPEWFLCMLMPPWRKLSLLAK